MSSELIFRGHDPQPTNDAYSPKPHKPWPWLSLPRPIRYLLREQRLLFVLVGIALATFFFTLFPSSPTSYAREYDPVPISYIQHESDHWLHKPRIDRSVTYRMPVHSGGKIPLGIKRKGLRIVVTGGAGFVGSHLVDRLIARGDSVIVVDNFFTGRKENLMHHFGNPRFELIRHDVVEPLLLEVDQIYHLACPASPVHYKFNPVKTITNVVGTLNMLGLAKRVGARFLLTSTSEVYGDPLQHPQKETYWGNVNPIGWSISLSILLFLIVCIYLVIYGIHLEGKSEKREVVAHIFDPPWCLSLTATLLMHGAVGSMLLVLYYFLVARI